MQVFRQVDDFENLWFPRTRAIIRRVVPKASRERFAEVFFQDMEQQRLGPAVIGSVSKFIKRVEELPASKLEGAATVRTTLAERGLTDKTMAAMRALLESVRDSSDEAPPSLSAAARRKAAVEQLEALSDLRDWFNDWATTVRPLFNVKEQITLGLTEAKRGSADEDEGDPATDEPHDPSEPPVVPAKK